MCAIVCYTTGRRIGLLLRSNIPSTHSTMRGRFIRRNIFTTTAFFDTDKQLTRSEQTWIVGAAVLFGVATACLPIPGTKRRLTTVPCTQPNLTTCDFEKTNKTAITVNDADAESPGPQNDFGAVEVENDPYAKLPEVDEETSCEICNTFRKGPCRKYWRKTERCWKEGDSDKCLPYSTPFINCSMYYRNLYVLVMLDNYQEYITAMEMDAKSIAVREFSEAISDNIPYVTIDWNPWNEFNNDFGPSFSQTIPLPPSSAVDHPDVKKSPMWQRLPPDTEPILVPCNVKIPSLFTTLSNGTNNSQHMKLTIAYVTDQDGFVVGKYFTPTKFSSDDEIGNNDKAQSIDTTGSNTDKLSVPSEPSEAAVVNENTGTSAAAKGDEQLPLNDDNDSGNVQSEIACIILPGETKSIVVTAYYTDESRSDVETEEEALVYKKVYDLDRILLK